MPPSYAGAGYFADRMASEEIQRQEQKRRQQEKDHSRSWWKRGLGQGILGALPGLVTLNPAMAAAGAAGGFGGEAVNHFGFKDKHPEIAGNAAALAALGSGAAMKGAFSGAANKAGLDGLQRGAANMGNNAAYNAEIAKVATPQFNSSGAALPQTRIDPPALDADVPGMGGPIAPDNPAMIGTGQTQYQPSDPSIYNTGDLTEEQYLRLFGMAGPGREGPWR